MTVDVRPLQKVYKYNGILLPELPGFSDTEARDFYSSQYPELVNAEIVRSEPTANGKVEVTFRRAVGTKGLA